MLDSDDTLFDVVRDVEDEVKGVEDEDGGVEDEEFASARTNGPPKIMGA